MNAINGNLEKYVRGKLVEAGQGFAVLGITDKSLASWHQMASEQGTKIMRQSQILDLEIVCLQDEVKNIVSAAEAERRKLTPEETMRCHAITKTAADDGEPGLIETKEQERDLAAAKEREASMRRQAQFEAMGDFGPEPVYDNAYPNAIFPNRPRPQVKSPTLNAFKWCGSPQAAERKAYELGLWFAGRVRGESHFLEKYRGRCGDAFLATMNESSPTSGGYLVPVDGATTIMQSMQDTGVATQVAKVVDVKSDNFSFPKTTSGTSVVYPGEEGSISASDMALATVTLAMKKRAIYSLLSNEIREDSLPQIMDILFSDMAYQLAKQQDAEMILGDGTSTYGGVTGIKTAITAATASLQSATTNNDTWPELTIADFGLLMSKLPAKYRQSQNLKFLCSPAFKWGVMDRLSLAAGGALATDIVDGQPRNFFLGYPVVLSDDMPSTTATNTLCCIFGNFDRAVLLGRRSDIRLAISEHIAFQTDQTAVRCTARWDIAVHEEGDTSNAGAIVGLKTSS